jgi:uncharacterized protein YbjQ (UPF0145 family)
MISVALAVLLTPGLAIQPAHAADDLILINVSEAMTTPEYQQKLNGSVKFYFGNSPHPAVAQTYGERVTNRKTNGFAKEAGVACRHVLLSALIALQDEARSLGGNAVVNIKSYFRKNEVSNDQQAECYKGFFIASVALKGDIVKLAGN